MSRYLSSEEFPARLWLEIVISAVSEFTCHLGVSRPHLDLSSWRLQNFHLLLSSLQLRTFHLVPVISVANGFIIISTRFCHLGGSWSFLLSMSSSRQLFYHLVPVILTA
ncbi:hypothetical protein AVEN_274576-1 [Araneus ventricosus]|uniref:Uncharacterized protein n=1 Tax=Araneus ventricosus TaxID=182803 RepID=A0A4Y2T6K5_ARAVE|nr:hypothetical protein AVEN_274576-1 [Araneus ventricosus]